MSTPNNLTKVAQTTLVQAGGLNKLGKPTTLAFVKAKTLDHGRHLSMLGGSTNSLPSYLSKLLPWTPDELPQHRIISFDIEQPLSAVSRLKA